MRSRQGGSGCKFLRDLPGSPIKMRLQSGFIVMKEKERTAHYEFHNLSTLIEVLLFMLYKSKAELLFVMKL